MTPDLITQWEVSIFPWEDHESRAHYSIKVEYRGLNAAGVPLYAVTDGMRPAQVLDAGGVWTWDDRNASDLWREAHRFVPSTALRIARQYAPMIMANGKSAAERYREWYGKDHDHGHAE